MVLDCKPFFKEQASKRIFAKIGLTCKLAFGDTLAKLWRWRHKVNSTIFTGKGDADTGPSTGTVDAQAPVFARVQQASIGLQWLMFYKHDIQF